MINRTMVRTRVIQTLFAYYKDGDKTPLTAKKELLRSFSDTYSLYMILLDFVNALTAYAEEQIDEAEQRAKITHTPYKANRRFVNNRMAQQVFNNHTLRNYVDNEHLSWDSGRNAVASTFKKLQESKFYQLYMAQNECTYEDDKRVWKHIFADILPTSEELKSSLEDLEITLDHAHWTTDIEIVLSFVVKTIKHFSEDKGDDQQLLQMFDKEEELNFGKDLLRFAIENQEEYQQMIYAHLKNWDPDRVAYMDKIILQTALAEIINFPMIALEISMNEYIELAKEFSGDKSHLFINGILNEILLEKKRDNSLIKTAALR